MPAGFDQVGTGLGNLDVMKKFFTLLLTIFWLALAVSVAQECSTGTNAIHRNHNVSLAQVNSYPGGRWSSTKPRYSHLVHKSKPAKSTWLNPFQGSGRRTRQPDFPLERCAILAMSGVGIGYLADNADMGLIVGAPAIMVATALPFPGQSRNDRFRSKRRWGQKAIGLLAFTVSYAVGLGVGEQLVMRSPTQ
jgi:hypothetical protein